MATDQVGSPRVVVDATGVAVKVVLESDSFGTVTVTGGSNPGFELSVGSPWWKPVCRVTPQ